MVENAVLFETFARADYARQVFEQIKKAQPKKLYFYSNKARLDHAEEIKMNDEIRSWIKEIDWPCDLHTFFRDKYVDVYTSLKGAIDWLFENEEQGIVLEDDCVPSLAFFDFCDQLLNKFKTDKRIWCLSGDNYLNINPGGYDYIFSHYHWFYGWATWRDRWQSIQWNNLRIDDFNYYDSLKYLFKTKMQLQLERKTYTKLKDFLEHTHCWDYIFSLTINQNSGLQVYPKYNLVQNIGIKGTHSCGVKSVSNKEVYSQDSKYSIINEPTFFFADYDFDYITIKALLKENSLIHRLWRIIYKMAKSY